MTMCEREVGGSKPRPCETRSYQKSDGSTWCGLFVAEQLNGIAANERCKELNARLPEIKSEKENRDILSFLVSL